METTDTGIEDGWLWHERHVLPLIQSKDDERVIEVIEAKLAENIDSEFRYMLMSAYSSFLTGTGRHAECLALTRQRVSVFPDDPFAWNELANCLHFAFHRPDAQPTSEEKDEALIYWRRALEIARKQQIGMREISFAFCRALTDCQMWPELETVMRGILETLENPCQHDTRDLHDDWLEKIPDGAIDGSLRHQYQTAVDHHRISVILTLEALVRNMNGSTSPFALRIWAPDEDAKGGYFCTIHCPFIRKKLFRIYGVDEQQACELTVTFLRNYIEGVDARLVDADGEEVEIPGIEFAK